MVLLEGKTLTKRFGGLVAVKEVDFFVKEGEILGLIGPNGSGKTTLLNLISGVYRPDLGTIKFNGEDITNLKPHERAKKGISRTFQILKPLSNMTVLENVMLGVLFKNRGISWHEAEKESKDILKRLGLASKVNVLAKELGVFDLKRLEIAKALSIKPKLLLFDEIMAGLNPAEVLEILEFLRNLRKEGMSLVVVEHNIRAIMMLCDRIMVLHSGEKIAEGTPKEIASNEKVIEVYLGSPLL